MPTADPRGLGDRNDQTRRNNLSTLLTLLHREGPLSRAELTRRTGLNRSSIGTLVGELGSLGLAGESAPTGSASVGRPSPLVSVRQDLAALAVHPDIDAITVGLVGLGGRVYQRHRYPTRGVPDVDRVITVIERARSELSAGLGDLRTISAGIAVPGLVRADDGLVRLAPHLRWRDEPVGDRLSAALRLPVIVGNDAAAAASAETVFGAGRGETELIYFNGSASGIGGGVVSGGRAVHGRHGYAGELGHLLVNHRGRECFCGRRGCLETEVRRERLLQVLDLPDADPDDLDRLLATDPRRKVGLEVARQLDWLVAGMISAADVFNPSMIVLGGFLGSLLAADPDRVQQAMAAGTFGPIAGDVRVARAELGADLPMIAAAELAFGPLLADPAVVARQFTR